MVSETQPLASAIAEQPTARRLGLMELTAARRAAVVLTGLVALSAIVRFALAWWLPVPWIFADELKVLRARQELRREWGFCDPRR